MNQRLAKKKILVVDDEVELCQLMADELNYEGAEVHQAYCGNDGIEKSKALNCDAVVSDLNMPKGTGADLLSELKKMTNPPVVIIFLTGFGDIDAADLERLGADAIFSKPVDMDVLIQKLKSLLD